MFVKDVWFLMVGLEFKTELGSLLLSDCHVISVYMCFIIILVGLRGSTWGLVVSFSAVGGRGLVLLLGTRCQAC